MVKLGFSAKRVAEKQAAYNADLFSGLLRQKKMWLCTGAVPYKSGMKLGEIAPEDAATTIKVGMREAESQFEVTAYVSVKPGATQDAWLEAFGTPDYLAWIDKQVPATLVKGTRGSAKFAFAKFVK
jgi:hypothetical protein